jgi:membrane-associated protease RseP (regulator of RpoE activity)
VDPAGRFHTEPSDPDSLSSFPSPGLIWRPRPKFQDRVWLHVLLFVLTIATTTAAGVVHYLSFVFSDLPAGSALPGITLNLILHGLPYMITILAILGCHEFGHYFACRYYDVDASLPFFLPVPITITGTLGAFIRIREPIPTKRMLFDIGIAGPLAGFAVAIPALLLGISMSRLVKIPVGVSVTEFGEPLLFKFVIWLIWGSRPAGYDLALHPIGFGAWFGLLATALNLFPAGQLDGGHIAYAVMGRRSTYLTMAVVVSAIVLSFISITWVVWTVLMIAMLFVFGPNHPRTFDEEIPLDRTRRWLAVVALIILALCFTPAPISQFDLTGR